VGADRLAAVNRLPVATPVAQQSAGARPEGFVSGNVYDKYGTRNPLYRALMRRFLAACRGLLAIAEPRSLVEVGCGPGDLARGLDPEATLPYVGTDLSLVQVFAARRLRPGRRFVPAAASQLPFRDRSVDLVVACEVLEHLDDPEAALAEAARVSRGHVLVSVPWEPVWRLLNLARGAYWGALGNTPGHVQRFSRRALRRLVSRRLDLVAERRPFPWTVLLARKRAAAAQR